MFKWTKLVFGYYLAMFALCQSFWHFCWSFMPKKTHQIKSKFFTHFTIMLYNCKFQSIMTDCSTNFVHIAWFFVFFTSTIILINCLNYKDIQHYCKVCEKSAFYLMGFFRHKWSTKMSKWLSQGKHSRIIAKHQLCPLEQNQLKLAPILSTSPKLIILTNACVAPTWVW